MKEQGSDVPKDEVPAEFRKSFARLLLGFANVGVDAAILWRAFDVALRRRGWSSMAEATGRDQFLAWSEGYAVAVRPFTALFAGASVPTGTYPMVDYLGASCATMGEGMERLARFFKLIQPEVTFRIDVATDRVTVEFENAAVDSTFFDEWTVGVIVQRFRTLSGQEFPLLDARFKRTVDEADEASTPALSGLAGVEVSARSDNQDAFDVDRVRAFLACAPQLGRSPGGFVVSRATWDLPMLFRDDAMRANLEAHAERMLAKLDASAETTRRVREVVAAELRGGDPSIENAARALATTPRTLQRRLREEGQSFQDVLDALRADLADRYLEGEGLSVTEVAFLLGYSEASSFARAYRRWKGRSPTEARRPLRERAAQ